MREWPTTTIKESSYLKGRIGWQGLRADEFLEEGPYLITGTDFSSGKIDWSNCYHVSEWRFREAAYIHVKDGDILITKDGTIGKVALVSNCPEKAVLNSGIFLLRCKDGSYSHWFAYYVLTSEIFSDFLRKYLNGSTINHLYQNVFERFCVPLPDRKVQQKIARILKTIDRAIEKTEALIDKYQQIKAGLMHDLFTRGIGPDGQLRPPREQAPELYQETPIGWIPGEWGWEPLESLLAPVPNNIRSGPFGSSLLKSELVENGIPFLGIDNIHVERFVDDFRRHVSEKKFLELSRYAVRARDVVITIMGTVGRSAVVPDDIGRALSSKHLWTMTFDSEVVVPELVCWQLNYAPWVKSWFRKETQGGIMDAIQSQTLRTVVLPVIPMEEQDRIFRGYITINNAIASEEKKLRKLCKEKSGLMHDLLTGKVPVQVEQEEEPEAAHV
ncbi:restriction endonuclease subunit S [Alcanivorax jadensis]|uniref:restriction endonuclease subunit S n=1 Tax=Alcanivorax jadensis TaxID=64988 RepID=UPI0026F0136C|nr:restriction endonuclease subunit S [Alcanivorax jadensis]MCK5886940.1 restriction endonuclease subunit S [Alcanivorax sp.]